MRIEDGLYAAVSSARVLARDLDAVTENLANVATSGYKGTRPVTESSRFSRVLADTTTAIPLPEATSPGRDWTHGPLTQTEGPLDVALGSDAMLEVQTPRGVRFTRDGRFTTDKDGRLTRLTGEPVLDAGGAEIRVPQGTPTIKSDGTLVVDGNEVAKIGAFDIPDRNVLIAEGDGLFRFPDGGTGDAIASAAPRFLQGEIEGSNVNAPRTMVDMIEVHRSYEAVMHAVRTLDGLLGRATQNKGG
ncbi:MAG: flagellar hook basal-body protein [Deltaproteobacteria bacterium]|jgi:flagellar basal-body rod protein FlgF|nr:flagellar hook basal-body protein [Deltaproteobacteria bacterium]